jgi:hypothetical protein
MSRDRDVGVTTLYVTSMRTTLDERQLLKEPLAGLSSGNHTRGQGLAETPFAG